MMMEHVSFRRADNARIARAGAMGGWDQVRQRLNGDDDGRAMLFFFANCHHVIRTLPVLQHDETKVEDLMTDSEDHAADEVRYACMSRPWVAPKPKPRKPLIDVTPPTLGQMTEDFMRRRRGTEKRI
jgi:hypothetical protein